MQAEISKIWNELKTQEARTNENERSARKDVEKLNKKLEILEHILKERSVRALTQTPGNNPGCSVASQKYLTEYGIRTSLHGFQYITDKRSPLIGRLLWIILLVISFVLCFYCIGRIWCKWKESPYVVSISSNPLGTEEISFPAVTVCRNWKLDESFDIQEYESEHGRNDTVEILKILCSLKGSYYPSNVNIPDIPQCTDLGDIAGPLDYSKVQFLHNVEPLEPGFSANVNQDIFRESQSENWTKPVLTDYGICRSFNIIHGSDMFRNNSGIVIIALEDQLPKVENWSPDHGYTTDFSLHETTYPRRTDTKMLIGGLSMHILEHDAIRPILKPDQGGYKKQYPPKAANHHVHNPLVSVHFPADLPNMLKDSFDVPEYKTVRISVSPTVATTSENLRSCPIEKRGCVFPGEKKLEFFKPYNWINCEMERFEELSAKKCGCVGVHVARPKNVPYCGTNEWDCRRELFEGLNDKIYSLDDCPGTCKEIQYHTEISIDALHTKDIANYGRSGKLEVYLKDLSIPVQQKTQMYDWAEFLAFCGGLLCFFLGGSILTLLEVIYFFTIRHLSMDSLSHFLDRRICNSQTKLQEVGASGD